MNSAYQVVGGDAMFGGKIQAVSEMMADQLNGVNLSGDFGEFYGRKSSILATISGICMLECTREFTGLIWYWRT